MSPLSFSATQLPLSPWRFSTAQLPTIEPFTHCCYNFLSFFNPYHRALLPSMASATKLFATINVICETLVSSSELWKAMIATNHRRCDSVRGVHGSTHAAWEHACKLRSGWNILLFSDAVRAAFYVYKPCLYARIQRTIQASNKT